jgi:hypothetical protein
MVKQVVLILLLLVPIATAFEIDSDNYSAQSYHYGLAGTYSESTTYLTRATTTYQQGSSGQASSTSYVANIGHFDPIDVTPPNLTNIQPTQDEVWSSSPIIDFIFNVSDNDELSNCQLYLDDTYIQNETAIINGGTNTISRNLGNGDYEYYILCYDPAGNNNSINKINFTVVYQAQSGGGGYVAPKINVTEEEGRTLEEFLEGRERPTFRSDDLKLVFFLILLWAFWYLFLYAPPAKKKPPKTVYIR